MLDTKNIPDFLIFFDLASYRLFVVQHFGYCGLVYDFGHLVNCHKLTSDQRRLIVRYLYLRFATGNYRWVLMLVYFRDLQIGNFRSNRISNRIGGYDSNSNRISNRIGG